MLGHIFDLPGLGRRVENQLLELPSFISPVFAFSAHEDDTGLLFEDGAKAVPATDDNDPVYTIVQPSGFGAVDGVQATTANRALLRTGANGINGHNALLFDGTSDFYTLTGITASSGPKTFYFVVDSGYAGNDTHMYFDCATGRLICYQSGSGTPGFGYFDGTVRNVGVPTLGAQILCYALGSGTGTVYRNGAVVGSAAYVDKAIGGNVALGASNGGTSAFLVGKLGSVYCDNALHDATKRAEMFAYLSQQWGITVS